MKETKSYLNSLTKVGTYLVGLTVTAAVAYGGFIIGRATVQKENNSSAALMERHISKVNRRFALQEVVVQKLKGASMDTSISTADRIYYLSEHTSIPLHIICGMIEVESGWNMMAVSSIGAKGLMQVMPATAKPYLATNNMSYFDKALFNPIANVTVGISYLKDLHDQYIELGVESETEYAFTINTYFWGTGNVHALLGRKDARVSGPSFSYYRRVMDAAKSYEALSK